MELDISVFLEISKQNSKPNNWEGAGNRERTTLISNLCSFYAFPKQIDFNYLLPR